MATQRFNYNDKFRLNGKKVGISSASPEENLDVASGTLKGVDLQSNSGITTFSTYEGFLNKKTTYTENVQIDTGVSGSLSGEIVVGAGLTVTVGTAATSGQGDVECLKVFNVFNPPCGGTANRPAAATPGTLYYNKDFRTIEYWDGNFWRQVDNTTRRGRGITMGGGGDTSLIQYFDIASKGNAQNFGELHQAVSQNSCNGNHIRSLSNGSTVSGPDAYDYIQYVTIQSQGNSIDFGNLTVTVRMPGSGGSSTRGLTAGGVNPSASQNVINYVEFMTLGDALDFGDLTEARRLSGSVCSSSTRTVFHGGSSNPSNKIDFVITASKGNATDFGTAIFTGNYSAGCSNSVKGLFGGGSANSTMQDKIGCIILASTGNEIEFGNLTLARHHPSASSNSTRACWAGGGPAPSGNSNVIDYITIQTGGSAEDFGDLVVGQKYHGGTSDSHGGLGGF
tara:strand:+ start:2484 stop:3836 length:1353 start_codon:yes stop_codon:yes gene_type:complete